MIDLNYEIGLAELALVEVAGGTLLSESALSAQGDATTTLLAAAPSQALLESAGTSAAEFPAVLVVDAGVSSTGTGVFTPEVQAFVAAVLAANGAAVVSIQSDMDPRFSMTGTATTAFSAVGIIRTELAATANSVAAFDIAQVTTTVLTDGGYATTTMLASADANTDFVINGVGATGFAGSAYGATAFAYAGDSAVNWHFTGVTLAELAAAGLSTSAFDFAGYVAATLQASGAAAFLAAGGGTTNTTFAAAGGCTLVLSGDLYYDALPRAWDYVIRPFELRGVARPSEIRGIIRPYEQRDAVRPAEDRDVLYS